MPRNETSDRQADISRTILLLKKLPLGILNLDLDLKAKIFGVVLGLKAQGLIYCRRLR